MANRDWTANSKSALGTLGVNNSKDHQRAERDYYATSPDAVEWLLKHEAFSHKIWEPACGELSISKVLKEHGYEVRSSDIVSRCEGVEEKDFLLFNTETWEGDIVTNPPFAMAQEFVEQALRCVTNGHKVVMLLRIQFLEGVRRNEMFKNTPPYACISQRGVSSAPSTETLINTKTLGMPYVSVGLCGGKATMARQR